MQVNFDRQNLTIPNTSHNRGKLNKGLDLLRSLGRGYFYRPKGNHFKRMEVIKADSLKIYVLHDPVYNDFPQARIVITNENKKDYPGYHANLLKLESSLVEEEGIECFLSYAEIAVDTQEESRWLAFKKYAIPKWIDLIETFWCPTKGKKEPGFNPDPWGNQYFKGRSTGNKENRRTTPRYFSFYIRQEEAFFRCEMRIARPFLKRHKISNLPTLFVQALPLIQDQVSVQILRPEKLIEDWTTSKKRGIHQEFACHCKESYKDLENKSSAEALSILTQRFPEHTKTQIRRKYFEKIPFPKMRQPNIDNIYMNKTDTLSLEKSQISQEDHCEKEEKKKKRFFIIDPGRCF